MSETILGGYPKVANLQKSRIKKMTANQQILDKMPYTIKLSEEPQRTMLYNIWCRCHTEKNNSFITTIGGTGCVDSETEFLTPYGWRKISEYRLFDLVMQYDPCTNKGNFVLPEEYIRIPENKMYLIKTKYGLNQCLSPDHKVLYKSIKTKKFKIDTMQEVYEQHNKNKKGFGGSFVVNFHRDNRINIPINFISVNEYKLIVAIICDGNINVRKNGLKYIRFNLKKQRKVKRLLNLLNLLKIKYKFVTKESGFNEVYFHYNLAVKSFPMDWYGLPFDILKVIANESLYWDGNCKNQFLTTIKQNADFIQYCFVATGKKASICLDNRVGRVKEYCGKNYTTKSICYTVIVADKHDAPTIRKGSGKKPIIEVVKPVDGYKYCFSVPTGFLVLRRNNCVFITGNSGKSYTNIYFGYMLDVDKEGNHLLAPENIIFDPSKFVDKAFNPSHVGEFIMKDEIEMDANSRSSFSKLNRIICDVISTVRYKRGIIFFNLPTEQQLDIQILRLRFGNIICDEVAKDGTYSKFHFEYTQGAKKRDDKYTPEIKRTRLFNQKFIRHPLYEKVMSKVEYEYLKLYLPVQKPEFRFLLKDYDKRKNEYLKEKYDMFRSELNAMNVKEQEKDNDVVLLEKFIKTMEKNKDYFCPNGKKASVARIQSEFKVTISKAKLIASEFNNVAFPVAQKKEATKERSEFLQELLDNKKGILK